MISSGKFKEIGQIIPPLTVQTPLKKESSSKREESKSSYMEVDSIHLSKKLKTNHDQDEDDDVTTIEKSFLSR